MNLYQHNAFLVNFKAEVNISVSSAYSNICPGRDSQGGILTSVKAKIRETVLRADNYISIFL